jgi:hypothetical protein
MDAPTKPRTRPSSRQLPDAPSDASFTKSALAPSSHAVRIDVFPQADALQRELRTSIKGEVRFDRGSRAAYSMDASNYPQIPIAVVVPRDEADAIMAVSVCRKFGAPILSRGGGTSLAGQGCNVAVVLDFSKYFNRILELDPQQGFARVQPGLVLDTLRDAAEKYGLTFAPDPSTHNRCTLGGMIGNNSSGTHSLMGGKVQDNVEELRVLLYDGTLLTVGPTSPEELAQAIRKNDRRAEIYSGLLRLRDRYGDLARDRFAKIPRRVSGYNFDELLPQTSFNIARALVGSEGTCVIVLEAKVRLVHSPRFKSLVCLGFRDVFVAADFVPDILRFKPIALEGFEGDGLFPHHCVAHRLRQQTFTLSSFLQTRKDYEPPKWAGKKVLLHGHCHHKAVLNFEDEELLLKRMGVALKSLDSGCCGMAGPFGFEKAKVSISRALGERVLLPAIRSADPDTIVVTDGFSCREQIVQNTDRQPLHIAEVLRMAQGSEE